MGTHYQGKPEEILVLDTWIKLTRAVDSVGQNTKTAIERYGLTVPQFGILEMLYHLGPLCQKTIGQKLLRSRGNITMVVDNLEKRGLVRRVQSVDDRRFSEVHLTQNGRDLISKLFPEHVQSLVEVFRILTSEEQQLLGELCKKLGLGTLGTPGQTRVV
jgi:MarR family 2-MHQ and catechol resistance regulon transcriptional repressor